MAKKPANSNQPWTATEMAQLRRELKENTPTRVMGLHQGRSPVAVQAKVNALGLSTKPTNQSPNKPKRKPKR